MNEGSRGLRMLVWAILGLVMVAILVVFINTQGNRSKLPQFGTVQPFTLTNQLGETVTLQTLRGNVWVADIIFARCPGPCPKMTEEMAKLQSAFATNQPLRFVTLTTDPKNDTVSALKEYAEKFSADPARWHFLTGPRREIVANLAVGSLKLATVEKDKTLQENENDLFIHATMFVLVDKAGEIRGFYESLEPGFQEKIRADINSLLAE
ncbi:MAG: SCO family protein [Limisphaerales bacterium]